MKIVSELIYGKAKNDLSLECGVGRDIAYKRWFNMVRRCYSEKYQSNKPTYIGCTVCDEWLLFSNFKKWFDENYKEDFHLDKDILIEGNKIYSPDTCRFIPQYLNMLLTDRRNARGDLPLGVTKVRYRQGEKEYIIAQCGYYGKRLKKTFKTVEEASNWYMETKMKVVKKMATDALELGHIKHDVFDALTSRNFNEAK